MTDGPRPEVRVGVVPRPTAMQLLTFTIAGLPYAIESRRVIEVLPLVSARPIPLVPDYVRGIFTYRGRLVPLVDLGRRLAQESGGGDRLSTRVIVIEFAPPGSDRPGSDRPGPRSIRLGLVAENVVSICSAEEAAASTPELAMENAPFLGRIHRIGGQTVQQIVVERLLPPDVLHGLYPDAVEAGPR